MLPKSTCHYLEFLCSCGIVQTPSLPKGDCKHDMQHISAAPDILQDAEQTLVSMQTSSGEVVETRADECLKAFANILACFALRSLVAVIGPDGSLTPAAYWLLQNRPLSGKQGPAAVLTATPLCIARRSYEQQLFLIHSRTPCKNYYLTFICVFVLHQTSLWSKC